MKPILFNTEMVRAILEGRKTQTRRVIKPQPAGRLAFCSMGYKAGTWSYPGDTTYQYWGDEWRVPEGLSKDERMRHWTPPCNTGDILYVRETWGDYSECTPGGVGYYMYRADYPDGAKTTVHPDGTVFDLPRWRPSIHMPKEAARIFLRVTDVRVERLNEIDEAGAIAEGAFPFLTEKYGLRTAREDFSIIWNQTVKLKDSDRYGWEANPWVWVISVERCEEPEEDAQC